MQEDLVKILLHLLTASTDDSHPRNLEPEFVKSFIDKHRPQHRTWLNTVRALGLGEKIKGEAIQGDEPHLRAYVVKKQNHTADKTIPHEIEIPTMGKVKTDVVEVGRIALQTDMWSRPKIRPAPPGCSVGWGLANGTLGCIVKKGSASALYILSNSHVIANNGLAKKGDSVTQPSMGAEADENIACLEAFVPFDFNKRENLCDAAIAKVKRKSEVTETVRILDIKIQNSGSSKLKRGDVVKKVGSRTDLTSGKVLDVDLRIAFEYPKPGIMGGKTYKVWFKDQVLCTSFTKKGDSGSAVLDAENNLVGLHFAGGSKSSIFNKIDNVFSQLEIELA